MLYFSIIHLRNTLKCSEGYVRELLVDTKLDLDASNWVLNKEGVSLMWEACAYDEALGKVTCQHRNEMAEDAL